MISKELFSEVMNIKIEDIIDLKMFGKDLKYYEKCLLKSCCDGRLSNHKDSICKSINIYELAHKCKEWAVIRQFYNVASLLDYTGYTCIIRQNPMTFLNTELRFRAGTEPEAICRACQYILDNKKEGN